jgi:hypothetical protein
MRTGAVVRGRWLARAERGLVAGDDGEGEAVWTDLPAHIDQEHESDEAVEIDPVFRLDLQAGEVEEPEESVHAGAGGSAVAPEVQSVVQDGDEGCGREHPELEVDALRSRGRR